MNKPTIAIDIDDVLAMHAEAFVAFSNKRWGTNLSVDDYDEHWAEVWQVDHEELLNRVAEYYDSGFISDFLPHDKSDEVLGRLSNDYRLVVLTSRQRMADKETVAWLEKHYGKVFDNIHYSSFYEKDDYKEINELVKMTKADLKSEIGFDYLIDDQLKHCADASKYGFQAVLFGDYSWNQAHPLPANVTRCKDWQEVAKFFDV